MLNIRMKRCMPLVLLLAFVVVILGIVLGDLPIVPYIF